VLGAEASRAKGFGADGQEVPPDGGEMTIRKGFRWGVAIALKTTKAMPM
jgi:hypothetical protein